MTLLACSSLGGIFSSAAADFGVDGVLERLTQIRPKLLVVTNGVVYAEQPRPLLPLLPKLLEQLDNRPEQIVVVDHLPTELVPVPEACADRLKRWDDWLGEGSDKVQFARTGFNEPIWILFSSGTTGESALPVA